MEMNKIQDLVFSFFDSIGAKRSQDHLGIWHAQIPPEERQFFNGYEEYPFTFDRPLAEKHRELELICEGSYLLKKIAERLAAIPKVSRLYSTEPPEPPHQEPGKMGDLVVLSAGKAHYRQRVIFTFKAGFPCDHRLDKLYSAVADTSTHEIHLMEGTREIDTAKFKETPDPGIIFEESEEETLRLYLQTCKMLESRLGEQISRISTDFQGRYQEELKKVETFLSEQKRELQQKKENVCFHLYFFQKEEEIEKMIRDLEAEHSRKIEELKEKYRVKVEIQLLNAIVLCIPTLGVSASYLTRKKRESLGTVIPARGTGELGVLPVL